MCYIFLNVKFCCVICCIQFTTIYNNRSLEVLICCLCVLNVSSSCDSPEKLKAILPRLEQELKDTGKFKDFYQFTFNFAKNPGQKGLGKPWN